jgi:hypothetical protein
MTDGPHRRNPQDMWVAGVLEAITLQGSEVIGIAKFVADFFKICPVARLALRATGCRQIGFQVIDDVIVIQKGVVDIEQKHDWNRFVH